jgi:toluene monooxygenase system protein E
MNQNDNKDMFGLPDRKVLKTYSHLADKKHIPSEYELTSSKMLYYFDKGGFEVNTPITAWYAQYQTNSLIKPKGLEQFVDPEQTTYTLYIKSRKDKEIVLDAASRQIDILEYDKQLAPVWMDQLAKLLAPLRYPWHGFQMISSYLGSMAPEGKIAIVFSFQTMDEMRRIQRIAYRMRQIQQTYPSWGAHSLQEWQEATYWQPLRKGIEHLLVTYDWLEAFVALNLCFKPILDKLVLVHYAQSAKRHGDYQLGVLFHSFWEDATWHQTWSMHLLELLIKQDENNKEVITHWLSHWMDELKPAVFALKELFLEDFDSVCKEVFTNYKHQLSKAEVHIKVSW